MFIAAIEGSEHQSPAIGCCGRLGCGRFGYQIEEIIGNPCVHPAGIQQIRQSTYSKPVSRRMCHGQVSWVGFSHIGNGHQSVFIGIYIYIYNYIYTYI